MFSDSAHKNLVLDDARFEEIGEHADGLSSEGFARKAKAGVAVQHNLLPSGAEIVVLDIRLRDDGAELKRRAGNQAPGDMALDQGAADVHLKDQARRAVVRLAETFLSKLQVQNGDHVRAEPE